MDTRRDFLKKAMLLSGAAGISTAVPASIKKAMSIDPDPGSDFYDAEHVVILMQENRSFDHCFGALQGVRGFNDPRAVTLPDKKPVWLQTNKNGETYAPFRFSMQDSKITWMGSIPHSRASQVDANNLGKYDRWLEAKKSGNPQYNEMPLTLGHYIREDLPFNYAMADAFTICDQHYCSAMTSTWPNRLYLWGGTIRAEKSSAAKAFIRNDIPYGEAHWKTFPERLEDNNVSWKVYQNDLDAGGGYKEEERAWLSNFGCNPLEFLSQYNVRFHPTYIKSLQSRAELLTKDIEALKQQLVAGGGSKDTKLKKTLEKKREVLADTKEQLGKWTKDGFQTLTPYQKNIYAKAFTVNDKDPDYRSVVNLSYTQDGENRDVVVPKGDVLYQFRSDVDNGKLPTVSWLVPSQNFSDHPSAPWYGTWLTSEILDILTKNPAVWKKTIFILTYDENDGYFDHVPPYIAPNPKEPLTGTCSPDIKETDMEQIMLEQELKQGIGKKEARGGPIGLGFRVPMIIASPWSRGGKVCSQVLDHTSSLQFLEKFLNKKYKTRIKEDNISDWRRAVCGDLTSAFTRFSKQPQQKLPFLNRDQFVQRIYNAKFKAAPTGYKSLTAAEIQDIIRRPEEAKWMPSQEPGVRPSTALPYEIYADGSYDKASKTLNIQLQAGKNIFGNRSAGVPFIVYAPGSYLTLAAEKSGESTFEPVRAWHYAVSPGQQLNASWPLKNFEGGDYHLRVYGPNGFYRELTGTANDPGLEVSCQYERKRMMQHSITGKLLLGLQNQRKDYSAAVEIIDNAYQQPVIKQRIAAGAKSAILLDLQSSGGWYDFTVKVEGYGDFSRRYAGRVETGKESITDPYMGRS
ncbi:MAG TPA: phospholipase C, phosphocholine-specific [Arachidicoccus sp.]|nr:phospholipase C, phosphocholine-specific [Arachidicoccus sp.]